MGKTQHSSPCVYGPSGNDAKLTLSETSTAWAFMASSGWSPQVSLFIFWANPVQKIRVFSFLGNTIYILKLPKYCIKIGSRSESR
jgi:hypothetical protein